MPNNDQFKKDIERLKEKSTEPLKSDKPPKKDTKDDFKATGTFYQVDKMKNFPKMGISGTDDKTTILKPRKHRLIKKISLAIISALIIGTISGFLILNLIAAPEETVQNNPMQQGVSEAKEANEDVSKEELLINYDFQRLQGYTLQLGVFSDVANAEDFVEQLNQPELPLVLWPRDELQYVIIGLDSDKDSIRAMAEKTLDESIDWFVKEWESEPFQLALSADEKEWIELFTEQWEQSLKDQDSSDGMRGKWEILYNTLPENTETLLPLAEHINSFINKEIENHLEIDEFLILAWLKYTKLSD